MEFVFLAFGTLSGAALAGVIVWLARGQRISALCAENTALLAAQADERTLQRQVDSASARLEVAALERTELEEARKRIFDLGRETAALRTDLQKTHEAHTSQVTQLTQMRKEIEEKFS